MSWTLTDTGGKGEWAAGAVSLNPGSTTTLTTSNASPTYGQSVTFTATVTGNGGTPTGTVTFKDGGTTLGTGTLSSGTATYTTSGLSATTHTITAVYGGDSNFTGSTSSGVTETVSKAVLTVTANNASKPQGNTNPTFTDTITGYVNGDSSSVVSGNPSLTTTATTGSPVGNYTITAAAGTLSASNYSFTLVNGTLSVLAITTFTWIGGGSTENWSEAANWGGTAPVLSAGADSLVFPSNVGSGTLTLTNDIAASGGDQVYSITFSSAGGSTKYVLTGNALQLSNTSGTVITASASGTQTINNNLTQPTGATQTITANAGAVLDIEGTISGGNQTLTVNCAGTAGVSEGDVYLDGAITISGGLTKTGIGTAYLGSNANTYSGATTVSAGILVAEANNALGGGTSVTVSAGACLALDPGVTTPSTLGLTLAGTGVSAQGGLLAVNATFAGAITASAAASLGASGSLTLNSTVSNTGSSGLTISSGTVVAKGALQSFKNSTSNPVVISNGATLQVDSTSSTTDVTVNSGAILAGIGALEIVTLGAAGVVSPGDVIGSTIGTLTLGTLNMTAGGTVSVGVTGTYSGGVQNDTLTVTGTLTAGSTSTLNVNMTGLAYGTHSVTIIAVNYGTLANNFGALTYTNKGSHASPGITLPSGKLDLTFTDIG